MTRRKVWLWCVAAIAVSGVLVRAVDDNLRIVPIVSKDDVVVSFDGTDAYTDDVRAAISSGLKTIFTYEIELRMLVPTWVDRTIASSIGATSRSIGIDRTKMTTAPTSPASRPTSAPSPGVIGVV